MPDTKLNLANLKEHLRKYLAVYIAGIAVALLVTNLLWTTTAPRVPSDQTVLIYLADAYSDTSALDGIAEDMLSRAQAFDDTLQAVTFESLMYSDDPAMSYSGAMLMMTRLALGEGDVFLASEAAMEKLVSAGALLGLDDYYADGWLRDFGLEPYYATVEYEEGGGTETLLAGFRLDGVHALRDMGAFNNEGAFLAVSNVSDNLETTMKAVEIMLEDLMNGEGGTDAP